MPTTAAQRREIDAVRGKLRSRALRLSATPCPCGGNDDVAIAEVDRYGLPLRTVVCVECGTLRFDPYLDQDSLTAFYSLHYQVMYGRVDDPDRYFGRQVAYGKRLLSGVEQRVQPGARVLEVGCGAGGALKVFQDRGHAVVGCDLSEQLIAYGRARGLRDLRFGDLSWPAMAELLDQPFGLIYLHHVFEHVADPVAFLTFARKLLSPQGVLVLAVPDVSRMDGYSFPAGDLRLFLHIAHKYNYSWTGMERIGAKTGFRLERLAVPLSEEAPEMWLALKLADRETTPSPRPPARDGAPVLAYLSRTERLRSLYLTHGQHLYLMRRLRELGVRGAIKALARRFSG